MDFRSSFPYDIGIVIILDMHTSPSRSSAFQSLKQSRTGFTLIELLVVIAIIGLLSSVILASLSYARQKSRDAKRIAEITQTTRALELFYDSNQRYPSTTPAGFTGEDAALKLLASYSFLPTTAIIPPVGTNPTYIYHGISVVAGVTSECTLTAQQCTGYEIGVTLERSDNQILQSDADQSIGTFYGAYPDCDVNTPGIEKCFDLKGG